MNLPKVNKIMGEMRDLQARRTLLNEELERSLAIQLLWKDAFKGGCTSARLYGNMREPHQLVLHLANKEGEERTFPLLEVPKVLILWHTRKWKGYEYPYRIGIFKYLLKNGRKEFKEELRKCRSTFV